MNPPLQFPVDSNSDELAAHHAATNPAAVFGHDGSHALDSILAGATMTVTTQQHQPRGMAMLNTRIIEFMLPFDFSGRKARHLQVQSLSSTRYVRPAHWPALSREDRGIYTESMSIIGGVHLVRQVLEPGADHPRFVFLPWRKADGTFKYVLI